MTRDTAKTIYNMIYKEISRFSLMELCASWGVSDEDVDEFMEAALKTVTEVKDDKK